MFFITSLKNPRVKDAAKLRDRRQRQRQGRILIDGARELRRALGAGVPLLEAFVCEPLCQSDDARHLLGELSASGCEVLHVSPSVFEKLAFGQRTEGVLGVAEMPRHSLESLLPAPANGGGSATARRGGSSTATPTMSSATPSDSTITPAAPLVAVLEGVEKPGNLGAVLRSADAAGVSAVIVADPRTDLYNPNAIRASLGTIFTMPVCEAESVEVLAWLRQQKFALFAARVDGAMPYTQPDYRGPTAFILGSEAAGLSKVWHGDDLAAIAVPMLGAADSLNVSITAAVLFYEALRQRRL